MPRIGINALCFSNQKAGVSTYAWNLIHELALLDLHYPVFVFIPSHTRPQFKQLGEKVRIIGLPVRGLVSRFLCEQVLLPTLFYLYRLSALHSVGNVVPLLLGNKNILTIHDVYFMHDTKRFSLFKMLYLKFFIKYGSRSAGSILTVSKCTAGDLTKFFAVSLSKISVIHNGSSLKSRNTSQEESEELYKRYKIQKPFFLAVGTLEPGKNFLNLLKAFKVADLDMQLVIAGKQGWGFKPLFDYIAENGLQDEIVVTGYLADEDLSSLYSKATALAFPSVYEGFGLPIIDAMKHGCPVCCSNTSCMPEVAADAALYFDPNSIEQIKTRLIEITDERIRRELICKGSANSSRFSWTKCAEKTAAVYKGCL